jgi:hypothetical protein
VFPQGVLGDPFVQRPSGSATRTSVLSTFVNRRDQRALNAYLFLLAINSSGEGADLEPYPLAGCLGTGV